MRLWKQAVRQLFRAPGFLSVAALALALGIGSTTTIFSIVRAVFLRGLPYADPESLVQLRSSVPEQQIDGAGFSVPRYEAVRGIVPAWPQVSAGRVGAARDRKGQMTITPYVSYLENQISRSRNDLDVCALPTVPSTGFRRRSCLVSLVDCGASA